MGTDIKGAQLDGFTDLLKNQKGFSECLHFLNL